MCKYGVKGLRCCVPSPQKRIFPHPTKVHDSFNNIVNGSEPGYYKLSQRYICDVIDDTIIMKILETHNSKLHNEIGPLN